MPLTSARKMENRLGPVDGRIVSVKDLFDIAGEPTLAEFDHCAKLAPPAMSDAEGRRQTP